MSEGTFPGEEWKHKPAPLVVNLKRRTRSEAQRYTDDLYVQGKLSLEFWRLHTELISDGLFDEVQHD